MTARYADIEAAEIRLEGAQRDYLARFGWKQTCNTPGCLWLWQRDFFEEDAARLRRWRDNRPAPLGKPLRPTPYGVITASLETALHMTRSELDRDDHPVCKQCGCNEETACETAEGPCYWVADNLCSACEAAVEPAEAA